MQLQSVSGLFAYHFSVTPGGWHLTCFARDQFYEPKDSFLYTEILARKLKEEGREHFRPVFSIDYVRGAVINVTWAPDLIADTDAAAIIEQHLLELENEYDLQLYQLVGGLQCKQILNGFCGTPSIRKDLSQSASTRMSTSAPVTS